MSLLKIQKITVFFIDYVAFFGSLYISLAFRYPQNELASALLNHAIPFFIIFITWVIIFYLFDLYQEKTIRKDLESIAPFIKSLIIGSAIAVAVLYALLPVFSIAPKTNLLIFIIIFAFADYGLRYLAASVFVKVGLKNKTLIIGDSPAVHEVIRAIETNPQFGYKIIHVITNNSSDELANPKKIISDKKIQTVIIHPRLLKKETSARIIDELFPLGVRIFDFSDFYELILKKIPLEDIEEGWFISNINPSRSFYEQTKRIPEIILTLIIGIVASPILLIAATAVALSSKGPVIYKQSRTGKNSNIFSIYKFRSMFLDAEAGGPQWSGPKDSRVTPVGKILRFTHIDELPQLINIIKGDVSFVGPRPERPEFINELKKQIPYYEVRHLVKPGITGWAQINYRYGSSAEDAYKKLQYDMYYLKNQSFLLDTLIILKTIKLFFSSIK